MTQRINHFIPFDFYKLFVGIIFSVGISSVWFSRQSFLLQKVLAFQYAKYFGLSLLVYLFLKSSCKRAFKLGIVFAALLAIYDGLTWSSHFSAKIPPSGTRYFIAGNLYNNELILPYYTRELDRFISHLGEENVFISIVEDHSSDRTPELLRKWSRQLFERNIKNNITTGFHVPEKSQLGRIERLAFLRNAALQPFFDPVSGFGNNTRPGDRVIFINDILFFKEDLFMLLDTNEGNYSAACSVDFGVYGLYDIWVVRDSEGRLVDHIYPHFISPSDKDLWTQQIPVRVFSCWNGVVVMDAHLVQTKFTNRLIEPHPFRKNPEFSSEYDGLPPPTLGIRFRESSSTECNSSECFLIWLDLFKLDQGLTLYLNPKVIVTYSLRSYLFWKEFHSWALVKFFSNFFLERRRVLPKFKDHTDSFIYQCST